MWTYAHEVLPSWDGGCVSTCCTKDVLDLPAGKQVLDVLRDAGVSATGTAGHTNAPAAPF